MEFDNLAKLINSLEQSKNDKCMICHLPINHDKNKIIFQCGHKYHNNCIKFNKKSNWFKCYYCKKSNYAKLCRIKECNKRTFNKNRLCINHNVKESFCQIILKSGKRKGQICNRIYCSYHKKIKQNNS